MELKQQIEEVLMYSQDLNAVKIDEIYSTWEKNKKPIKDGMLQGSLIYEYPEKVSFTLDEKAKEKKFEEFINLVSYTLNVTGDSEFYRLYKFLNTITAKEFYSNCLEQDYKLQEKIIPKGSKVIRNFKYFLTDSDQLKLWQDKASELIQENCITGTLCFSIHPLDYLSSSENISNWRSCHALDGEYRAGNLSYMMDGSTMVCYLRSDDMVKLPRFPETVPWNNKKWRCLLYFNEDYDVIFASRQYPFQAGGALDKIHEILVEKILPKQDLSHWSSWHNDYVNEVEYNEAKGDDASLEDKYAVIQHKLLGLKNLVQDAKYALNYNDLLNSTVYTQPYYMYRIKMLYSKQPAQLLLGHEVPCIYCGEKRILQDQDYMLCPSCSYELGLLDSDRYAICDRCGESFWEDEANYMEDNVILCPDCADELTFMCPICWSRQYNNQIVTLPAQNRRICKTCYSKQYKQIIYGGKE